MNTEMMKENRKQGEQLPHNEMRHPCRGCLYVLKYGENVDFGFEI